MNHPVSDSTPRRFRGLLAGLLLASLGFGGVALAAPPTRATNCDGDAGTTFAARANSITLGSTIAGIGVGLGPVPDTGELPAAGGIGSASLVTIDGAGTLNLVLPTQLSLHAGILDNATMGSGDMATARSSVLALDLGLKSGLTNLLSVKAGVLTANVKRSCVSGTPTTDAGKTGTDIASLQISVLGSPISIDATVLARVQSGEANVSVALPTGINLLGLGKIASGSIVLNEQFVTGNNRQVVNALHVKLTLVSLLNLPLATVDLVVSHAEAGVKCGTGSNPNSCNCQVKDFVTGGGVVKLASGGTANFGFNGGYKANGLQGHLNFINHDTREHLQGTVVTDYVGKDSGTTVRAVTFGNYSCTNNVGFSGACTLTVDDKGEPGKNVDGFLLSPNYDAVPDELGSATIVHGNLQLHKPNCGTTTASKPRGRK